MEKIQELLAKLENNVPTKIQNKLKSLDRLNVKLELAKKEHADEPTDNSKEQLDNVLEYVEEVKNEIIDDIEDTIEKLEKAKPIVVVAKEEPIVVAPVVTPQQTQEVQKPIIKKEEEKEGSGIGWFGLIGGVLLLVATAGVVNTLRK